MPFSDSLIKSKKITTNIFGENAKKFNFYFIQRLTSMVKNSLPCNPSTSIMQMLSHRIWIT